MNRVCASRQRCSISAAKSRRLSYCTSARSIETMRASCSTAWGVFSILTLGLSLRCDIGDPPQLYVQKRPKARHLSGPGVIAEVGHAHTMLRAAHIVGPVAHLDWAEVARLQQVRLHSKDVHARLHGIQDKGRLALAPAQQPH